MVIEMIEESFNEPFKTGPVIDQQGNYAIFDILMNRSMFDYIQVAQPAEQSRTTEQRKRLVESRFPGGSEQARLRRARRGDDQGVVEGSRSAHERQNFHTVDALVLMPRDLNETRQAALFAQDARARSVSTLATRRRAAGSGFGLRSNTSRMCPSSRKSISKQEQGPYNFYKVGCDTRMSGESNAADAVGTNYKNGLKFHDSKFKSQITRVVPLTDETKEMNDQFQKILGNTVWKNYMLLSTQWPSDFRCAAKKDDVRRPLPPTPATDFKKEPDMNCAPAPTFLANSTLETYSQGTNPLASSSCMACHGNAVSQQVRPPDMKAEDFFNQSDFTFMLEKARGERTR